MTRLASIIIFLCATVWSAAGQGNDPARSYPSGFRIALRTGSELYQTLNATQREHLHPQPISLETENMPTITPMISTDENRQLRQVSISVGLIDLFNLVAHAKAIDKIQPGYLNKFAVELSRENGQEPLQALSGIANPRYWTDAVMNDQESDFNQMVGMMEAIYLSHHYLGHYAKYATSMIPVDGHPAAINDFLTRAEWEKSVKLAALNSLNCALATEGIRALFETISRMPTRPVWTFYILPKGVDVKRLNHELEQYEKDFFRGQLKE